MPALLLDFIHIKTADQARSTLPDFRQLVHTCILFAPPFTLHFTLLMLELQIALLLL